jgi:hypothetical protein
MRMLHLGLVLALLISGAINVEAAPGKKGQKGKKGAHPIHGTVVSVSKDKGKDSGTLTVQVRSPKKKSQTNATAPVEKTFRVTDATKFQFTKRVKGQKGQKGQVEQSPATFANVQKGEHVIIQASGDIAADVKILQGGKKKNKKQGAL